MITYAVIGDVHLGHRQNPTNDIIANIKLWLNNTHTSYDFMLLFIEGDLFDSLLDYPNRNAFDSTLFASWLIDWCSSRNITLRILEGTPGHDWKQSAVFDLLSKTKSTTADVKFIDVLSIEHIERFNLDVLYVPDEWSSSTDDTLRQVKTAMAEKGLMQVDIAIMHGQFTYQLPAFIEAIPRHDESAYLALVKYFINIGHVHTHSHHDRILAAGSFDRLAHGEEEPKGGLICTIADKANGSTWKFVENQHARVFKTIDITNMSAEKAQKAIERLINSLPESCHVRVRANSDHPLLVDFKQLKLQYPMVKWSKLSKTVLSDVKSLFAEEADTGITITRDNLETLLLQRLSLDNDTQQRLRCYIRSVL